MAFSKEQLQKFAKLIRIEISDDELAAMNVDSVIDWINDLKTIDTTGIEPMFNSATHDLPRRTDIANDGGYRDAVLSNTPDKTGVARGYFAVPKIMDE